MFEKFQEEQQTQDYLDIDYQYQIWKEKQITQYEEMMSVRDEDYYQELRDEKFEKDLNDYYENYYGL
jgi:hypothetical protein